MTRGPTIVRVAPSDGNGVKCCCCRCCECFNLGYLISQHGLIKLAEAMLGGLCQTLLVKYGMYEAGLMGSAFFGFLTTASSCLLVTALLITCYTVSSKSQQLIRQSIFECLFNAVACFLYLSASSYVWVAVHLNNVFTNSGAPAMTAVNSIGVVLGILYGMDAYNSFKYYKGYR
ncbi:protein singles bar isoform X1 [Hyposmocoma kahamanoa]|uniref:protein singles bar isoform X1 n=1 Tax=Hyposmocoma kahamanoa TaxID=1477025 RepID=UPI000E6D5C82|nr:protein singles bar isoform X1 [Hyposmocoma kahamanoa]